MPGCLWFSCALAVVLSPMGCLSAETSEASQLTRLEHGIDVSTTPPDRFTSRGELPGDGKPVEAPGPTPFPGTSPVTPEPSDAPSAAASTATDDPADESPRPVIRVWGKTVYDGGASEPGARKASPK